MKRFLKIVILHFEHVFENRARSLIWFIISLTNPLSLILFWKGASNGGNLGLGWTFSSLTTYYLLLALANAFLTSHIEEEVSFYDIKQGDLVRYLIRPFSYYWIKFIEEIPYRLLQGTYGLILLLIFIILFSHLVRINLTVLIIALGLMSAILAFFISFTFKMIIGLLAFWFKDIRGLYNLVDIVTIVFAGYVVPLEFFPSTLKNVSYLLPFAYMIYYPVIIIQGKLLLWEILRIVGIQFLYLSLFLVIQRLLWKKGIKEFTAIGQ